MDGQRLKLKLSSYSRHIIAATAFVLFVLITDFRKPQPPTNIGPILILIIVAAVLLPVLLQETGPIKSFKFGDMAIEFKDEFKELAKSTDGAKAVMGDRPAFPDKLKQDIRESIVRAPHTDIALLALACSLEAELCDLATAADIPPERTKRLSDALNDLVEDKVITADLRAAYNNFFTIKNLISERQFQVQRGTLITLIEGGAHVLELFAARGEQKKAEKQLAENA